MVGGGGAAAAAAGLGGWVGGWRRLWRACKFGATVLPVGGGPAALLKARLGRTPATGREEVAGRTATATVLGGGSFAKKEKEFMGGFGEDGGCLKTAPTGRPAGNRAPTVGALHSHPYQPAPPTLRPYSNACCPLSPPVHPGSAQPCPCIHCPGRDALWRVQTNNKCGLQREIRRALLVPVSSKPTPFLKG